MSDSDSGARHDPRSFLVAPPSWPVLEDLHIHTTASDGVKTPSEIVEQVGNTSLQFFAITDHDTTSGLDEAEEANEAYPDMTFIPGIELSAHVDGAEIHLTCHFIDRCNGALQRELTALMDDRETKAMQIVERLGDLGLPISWDDVVENAEGAIGRPHIARAMMTAGYVDSIADAFKHYLSPGRPAYLSRRKLDGVNAIELVSGAGGVVTVAHPRTVRNIERSPGGPRPSRIGRDRGLRREIWLRHDRSVFQPCRSLWPREIGWLRLPRERHAERSVTWDERTASRHR